VKSSKKYKYYADHFQGNGGGDLKDPKQKLYDTSESELSKPDRSKSTSQTRVKSDFDTKSDDNNKTDTSNKKTFLAKGSGLGGGRGNRGDKTEDEIDEGIQSTPKFTHDDENYEGQPSPDGIGSSSNRSRRSRKARGPNAQSTYDTQDNFVMEKKSSLEEFEELEKGVCPSEDDYQVVMKNENASDRKKKKPKTGPKPNEGETKLDMNKTMPKNVGESASERKRLAKEKQEFRKQKEKFEADKLTLEKQKRDFEKQKLDFEKNKDVEMKKLSAEKQKIDKEKKALTRQNDKKNDNSIADKLYKEIDILKEELRKKDSKVHIYFL